MPDSFSQVRDRVSVQTDNQQDCATLPVVNGVRRIVYLSLAAVFFALGAAGVLLPVLPTTPFLLLCSYFLVRTSPRLNQMLLASKMFGPVLIDWQKNGGVRRSVKVKAILIALACAGVSLWVADIPAQMQWIVIVLLGIGITVICLLPEVRPQS